MGGCLDRLKMVKEMASFNYKGMPEAKGYIKLAASRGCFTVYGALFGTLALAQLAKLTQDCEGRILGGNLKTSSAIASTVFIEGLITAILSPYWGIISDNTSRRKLMYLLAHSFWLVMLMVQLSLLFNRDPTEIYLILFIGTAILMSIGLELSVVLLVSYLPEISADETDVAALTGRGFAWVNGLQLFLALAVTAVGFVGGITDPYTLALIAGGVTIFLWLWFTIPGAKLINERIKTKTKGGACRSLVKLKDTFVECVTVYPQVGIFLFSYSFFFAGVGNMVSLAAQFLLSGVGLTSFMVQVASAILLLASVFGALFLEKVLERFDLKKAYLICVVYWLIVSATGPLAMQGEVVGATNKTDDSFAAECDVVKIVSDVEPAPGAIIIVFIYSVLYGIGIGTSFGLAQCVYVAVIPGGQEGGYLGLKTVFSKLFVWAPALAFTAVNEAFTDAVDKAFLTLVPFFAIAVIFGYFLDIEKAKSDIAHTLDRRHDATMDGAGVAIKVDNTLLPDNLEPKGAKVGDEAAMVEELNRVESDADKTVESEH